MNQLQMTQSTPLKPEASIAIITYGRDDVFFKNLTLILGNLTASVELIIFNNNDYDIIESLRSVSNFENVVLQYHWQGANLGVPGARDICIKKAKCEFVIFLDDDAIPNNINDLIQTTEKYFNKFPLVAALAFSIVRENDQPVPEEIPHRNKDIFFTDLCFTYYFIGAGHALRRSSYMKVNGYQLDCFGYGMEELELSFRLYDAGFQVLYVGTEKVYHHPAKFGRQISERVLYGMFLNRSLIAARHLKTRYVISSVTVWGSRYLFRTVNFRGLFSALKKIGVAYTKQRVPFNRKFYQSMKDLNARLIY